MTKLARNKNNLYMPHRIPQDHDETGPAPVFTVNSDKGRKAPVVTQADRDRMLRGARNYAQGHKSDPHAFNVAMSHLKSGVSGVHFSEKGQLIEAFYDAKLSMETRTLPAGQKFEDGSNTYNVEVVVDLKRP